MGNENKHKTYSSTCPVIWIIGWLFTWGFLKYSFGQAVLAIIVWPYYLGEYISGLIK